MTPIAQEGPERNIHSTTLGVTAKFGNPSDFMILCVLFCPDHYVVFISGSGHAMHGMSLHCVERLPEIKQRGDGEGERRACVAFARSADKYALKLSL